jgi:NAD(P)-dependent dehydrogenase (short-subunit alcohol dehydrogenase family)
MNGFENKIALITGAKGGLGACVTQAFLTMGATVVGSSRSIAAADFPHPKFVPLPAELSSAGDARKLADEVVAQFQRIDVLVHVVGGFAGGSPVADTDDATLERMVDLNLRSVFHVVRAVVPHMRRQSAGRIIAVGSRAAVDPQAMVGAYNASKAAMLSLMVTLAKENADLGITANVVLPATMDTPANRAGDPNADFSKWVPPGKVASAILWLASDAASHVNGAAIPVYGRSL